MKKIFTILAILSVTACGGTRSGKKIDLNVIQSFEKGKTTYNEVVKKLGKPDTVSLQTGGKKYISYTYSYGGAKAVNYIPYVGAFIGGIDTKYDQTMLYFDKNDVLTDYSHTSSEKSTGTGIISGMK